MEHVPASGQRITAQAPQEDTDLTAIESHVDRAVLEFCIDMKYKLRRNNHKGLWLDLHQSMLFLKLQGEVEELKEAMNASGKMSSSKLMAIIHECADVSNYAMMIADKARRKLNGK